MDKLHSSKAQELRGKVTLSNKKLALKLREWVTALCKSNGNEWYLSIPPKPNIDPDFLITEAANRLDQYAQEQQSEGLPKPTDNALIKIGSALVHFDELTSIDGHPYDKVAAKTALEYEEVQNWLNKMADLALLPQRRKPPSK